MNKIYRTVWNKALGAFVAASELDSAQGKGRTGCEVADTRAGNLNVSACGSGVPMRTLAIAVLGCILGFGLSQRADAQAVGGGVVVPGAPGTAISNVGCSSPAQAETFAFNTGLGNIAIGCGAQAGTPGVTNGGNGMNVAIGPLAYAGGRNGVDDNSTVALGFMASALDPGAVALGSRSETAPVVNTPSATIGGQTYTFSGTNAISTVSVGGDSNQFQPVRTITNVAAGRVSTTSTDAINGSQLNAAVTAINTLSTSTSTGISSLSTGLSTTNSNVGSLSTGLSTVNSNIASLSTGVANAVQYDNALHTSVTLGGVGATTPVRLTNVAAGTAPTDAVNFGQLSSLSTSTSTGLSTTNSNVASLSTSLGSLSTGLSSTNSNLGSLSTGLSSTNSNVASLSTSVSNLSTTLNNVNGGNTTYYKVNDPNAPASQASGEGAVAGGGGAVASGDRSVALGKDATAAGTNSVAIGAGSVATERNTASFGTPGNERRLTNIAAGVNPTDATNLQQVNNAVAAGVGQANSYTDKRIADTNKAIGDVAKHAYSGIAAATALTMIPEVDLGKSIAVGVGAASFQGHVATAIGVSARMTENLKLKAGVGLSSGGQTYGGGVSYQW
ncbi:YadA-like family protein [Burkholderia sp. HI2714]|uniref:YadA-like family protein n=1 Tax=Burkholderia sp. HI2714 TaxID=2015359 RepID=UPI00117E8A00|nr:YadA-like family protein [Burkholderia sp. HI2714]